MSLGPASASFTIRGDRPVSIEVRGRLDAGAAVGLMAVVDSVAREGHVILDLTGCAAIDAAGEQAVRSAVKRVAGLGGRVDVCHRNPAVAGPTPQSALRVPA